MARPRGAGRGNGVVRRSAAQHCHCWARRGPAWRWYGIGQQRQLRGRAEHSEAAKWMANGWPMDGLHVRVPQRQSIARHSQPVQVLPVSMTRGILGNSGTEQHCDAMQRDGEAGLGTVWQWHGIA
jgi:hypothetical protein